MTTTRDRKVLRLGITLLTATPVVASAVTLHVPSEIGTIKEACAAAAPGDTVLIECGLYLESGILVTAGITVSGVDIENPCVIIDGEGTDRVFRTSGDQLTAFVGLHVKNGDDSYGAALYALGCPVEIAHCRFEGNQSQRGAVYIGFPEADSRVQSCLFDRNVASYGGGGIQCVGDGVDSLTIVDCEFSMNSTTEFTGGALNSDGMKVLLSECKFENNEAGHGGAIETDGFCRVESCTFRANTSGLGGAITCVGYDVDIVDSEFVGNTAQYTGGAVFMSGNGNVAVDKPPLVKGCSFRDNEAQAWEDGGGAIRISGVVPVYVENSEFDSNTAVNGGAISVWDGSCRIRECVLTANTASALGGAFYSEVSRLIVLQSTCVANAAQSGAAIYFHGQVPILKLTVERTIVAFSAGGAPVDVATPFSISSISCTDIFGNAGGDWIDNLAPYMGEFGNISADPQFCGLLGDDLELQSDSPCAPDHSGTCGLIGALPVGCGPVSVSPASWGSIKALYR